MLMAIAIDTRQADFSEIDEVEISKEYWNIMWISGMGANRTVRTFRIEVPFCYGAYSHAVRNSTHCAFGNGTP